MSSEPALDHDQRDVIQLDDETVVVLPLYEYRRLRALERRASAEDLDAAEADAVLEGHRGWVAAGRPGAMSHEEFMAELLGGQQRRPSGRTRPGLLYAGTRATRMECIPSPQRSVFTRSGCGGCPS